MNLFTINVNETVEDGEWEGMYNYQTTPTNFVFASFEDAYTKAYEMALQKIKEIDPDRYAVDLESKIACKDSSFFYLILGARENVLSTQYVNLNGVSKPDTSV